MSKRFTDSDKYKKPFIRGLKAPYKLLWDYLYHDCDHAGVWIKDFDIAQIYIGSDAPINEKDALAFFNADEYRVIPFDDGKKWFIVPFVTFQYGILNPQNRAHNSVISILKKAGFWENEEITIKPLISPLQGCKDKDKDKDKDKEINKGGLQRGEELPVLPLDIEKSKTPSSFEIIKENLHQLYGRRQSTEWSDKEIKQLRDVCKRKDVIQECSEIVTFYGWYEYRRRDIVTLLNNWTGELDKARRPKTKGVNLNGTGTSRNPGNRPNYFNNADAENDFKPTEQTEF